jgi:hypothetical protein
VTCEDERGSGLFGMVDEVLFSPFPEGVLVFGIIVVMDDREIEAVSSLCDEILLLIGGGSGMMIGMHQMDVVRFEFVLIYQGLECPKYQHTIRSSG